MILGLDGRRDSVPGIGTVWENGGNAKQGTATRVKSGEKSPFPRPADAQQLAWEAT